MKLIESNGYQIALIEVPENDIYDFEIIRDQDDYDQQQFKYPSDNWNGLQNYSWVNLPKGDGSWSILGPGLSTLCSEEDAAKVVDSVDNGIRVWFKDYELPFDAADDYYAQTATESLFSLIRSHSMKPETTIVLIKANK